VKAAGRITCVDVAHVVAIVAVAADAGGAGGADVPRLAIAAVAVPVGAVGALAPGGTPGIRSPLCTVQNGATVSETMRSA
jgi:hypothetical protein